MPPQVSPDIIIDATLYTLAGFALITWLLIFFKIWQFAMTGAHNEKYSSVFWAAPDLQTAERLTSETANGPSARVALCGFAWLNELRQPSAAALLKYRGSSPDLLEQTLRKQTQDEQRKLESGLTMLASIGSTAPFVGLFGTVLGIMHAMHEISQKGSASLDIVAGPIGDALIATAFGIAVAVPAVLAYNFFGRRAKQHRATLENFVQGFLQIAFVER